VVQRVFQGSALSLTHAQIVGYVGFGHSRSQHVEPRIVDPVSEVLACQGNVQQCCTWLSLAKCAVVYTRSWANRVLGSDTGRTQASCPNLMGIGRAFRPIVMATEGYGICHVDLSQVEVGIAAAVFDDAALIAAFNEGDVYVSLAKKIFTSQFEY
jgi:DNA polymerase family A